MANMLLELLGIAGGSSSKIGTVVLEYQLFPRADVKEEMPHIVV
jgi:hypothetical protein